MANWGKLPIPVPETQSIFHPNAQRKAYHRRTNLILCRGFAQLVQHSLEAASNTPLIAERRW